MTLRVFVPDDSEKAPPTKIGRVVTPDAEYFWWSDGWRSEQDQDMADAITEAYGLEIEDYLDDAHSARLRQICIALRGTSWQCFLKNSSVSGRVY